MGVIVIITVISTEIVHPSPEESLPHQTLDQVPTRSMVVTLTHNIVNKMCHIIVDRVKIIIINMLTLQEEEEIQEVPEWIQTQIIHLNLITTTTTTTTTATTARRANTN